MFLNQASVSRFKAARVPVPQCQSLARCGQDQDFQVEAWASDVMAGAGSAAGPAPDVRHQPPGDANEERAQLVLYIHNQSKKQYQRVDASSAVVMPAESMHEITGSRGYAYFFQIVLKFVYTCIYAYKRI